MRAGLAPALGLCAALAAWSAPAAAQSSGEEAAAEPAAVPEPEGYRLDEYRSPVPATLDGAEAIGTEEAEKLWRDGEAVFVDVLPRAPRPENLPEGTYWRPKPRHDIPNSVWLPNTGYGELSLEAEVYFADGLRDATHDDRTKPLVFYCLDECWMSWNAAKRALAMGYEQVFWYPEGTDGWAAEGLPLETREPVEGGS